IDRLHNCAQAITSRREPRSYWLTGVHASAIFSTDFRDVLSSYGRARSIPAPGDRRLAVLSTIEYPASGKCMPVQMIVLAHDRMVLFLTRVLFVVPPPALCRSINVFMEGKMNRCIVR